MYSYSTALCVMAEPPLVSGSSTLPQLGAAPPRQVASHRRFVEHVIDEAAVDRADAQPSSSRADEDAEALRLALESANC